MGLYDPSRRAGREIPALQAMFGVAGRPVLPPGFRYVLMQRKDLQGGELKPMAFHGVDGLARHIHRARARSGLALADAPMMLAGHDQAAMGVSVWLLDPATGERWRYLGWAWVNGASQVTLAAALQAAEPQGPLN